MSHAGGSAVRATGYATGLSRSSARQRESGSRYVSCGPPGWTRTNNDLSRWPRPCPCWFEAMRSNARWYTLAKYWAGCGDLALARQVGFTSARRLPASPVALRLERAGFEVKMDYMVVQLAVPTEVVVATLK